jgi:hypothetical protein
MSSSYSATSAAHLEAFSSIKSAIQLCYGDERTLWFPGVTVLADDEEISYIVGILAE